jgi:DnaJ-class molecular chaperone
VRDEWERVKLAYEILSDKKLRLKYDRNSALNDPGAAVGRMALEAVGWGATGLTKGFMELGGLAVKSATKAMQKKEAVQKKADMNSNRNTRSVTRRRSTNSGSTYSNFPAAAGDVMMMNTNGMATALATNDFEFQQMYTHHAQGQVFVRDPLEDMARLAKDAFNWGMVAMAQGMHSFGDFAVRFAASEAKRHTDEWKYKR